MMPLVEMGLALAIIVLQAVLIGAFLWGVKKGMVKLGSFTRAVEEYTESVMAANKSNELLRRRIDFELDQIGELKQVTQLNTELAAARAAMFVQEDQKEAV